jgi:hypothetical protein
MAAAVAVLDRHRVVAAVLALYVASAFVVPTLTPVPVGDDWAYARSVELLIHEHRLEILDLSVANLVFQVIWGALFALVFDTTFWALRLSTLVLVGLSGLALYALCRELGVDRGRSALGTAAYLFNPLMFSLSYSFMTDPHFTAWLVIATYFYVRGLAGAPGRERLIVLGSAFAAVAFLVRQQGALIPLAVVMYLLLGRRLTPGPAGLALVARVAAIPAAVAILYYLWLRFVNGVPAYQSRYFASMLSSAWHETLALVGRLAFIEVMYLGFFVIPIAAGAVVAMRRLDGFGSARGRMLFACWCGIVAAGLLAFGGDGRMPYVPHFVHAAGLGPSDLYGRRPWIFPDLHWLGWFTAACAAATIVFGLVLCRNAGTAAPDRFGAGCVLAIGAWQAVGVLPASFTFRNRTWQGVPAPSLDRYLLPLLPVAIVLLLWALRNSRLVRPVAWLVTLAFAVYAVVGTRDSLVFQEAIWNLAVYANSQGIPNTRLDAGAAWDGYHLYEYSRDNNIPVQTPGGEWWLSLFAPATNSDYRVAGAELASYEVVTRIEYSSWLQREPVYLYLLRSQDVAGPP